VRTPVLFALLLLSGAARADEGGVSFWVPGTFASFAAARSAPGWSMPITYYHRDTDARDENLVYAVPTYASNTPLTGTQAIWSLGVPFGRVSAAGDSRTSIGDLYPALTLKSGRGERTYMSYTMLGVPTGPAGTNHWSLDRSTAAAGSPSSTNPRGASFPRCSASPTTSAIPRPITATA
jgi:hypothetical protein